MIFLLLSIVINGLIIGALGRLVIRGPNPIGMGWTLLCGVGGSVLGGTVSDILFGRPQDHWLVTFILEVAAAASLVRLVTRRRHRPWA
jgi:uncharacterized membrane protein YeaQ/YmgE (transglycosylase-associated protein family)